MPATDSALIRPSLERTDIRPLIDIVRATGYFDEPEVAVAQELMESHLAQGAQISGYFFEVAERPRGFPIGYACHGPIPGTTGSHDLYWIVVAPEAQGHGVGKHLLATVLTRLQSSVAARKLYVETSARPLYQPTHSFYRRCGFTEIARLPDFYRPGDDQLIFCLDLAPHPNTHGSSGLRER
jgi:GNAT superfamily N-acetyltransferase